jgi:hypothetical protein
LLTKRGQRGEAHRGARRVGVSIHLQPLAANPWRRYDLGLILANALFELYSRG